MYIVDRLINIGSFYNRRWHHLNLDAAKAEAVCDFNNKILDKKVPFEEVPCLCSNDKFSLIASVDRYGLLQSTVICKNCGLIQSNPRMTPEYYKFFYESDEYRRLYGGYDFINQFETFYSDNRNHSIFNTVIEYKDLKEIKCVLEFGAGGGWNLVPFIKEGVLVKGYDFSRGFVELGRKKGINLFQGGIDDIKGKYDVIIANHIIEHFTDFMSDIKKLKSYLENSGIIYIGIPDIQKFNMSHLQNAHIYYFSLKTLQYYMGKCGLRMIHSQAEEGGHISGIFVKDEFQINIGFLDGHYNEMVEILTRYSRFYYPRHIFSRILGRVGLKEPAKHIFNTCSGRRK